MKTKEKAIGYTTQSKNNTEHSISNNYLLLIAIDDYKDNHIDILHNCKRDADLLCDILTTKFEFYHSKVERLYDSKATREDILGHLNDWSTKIKDNDTLIIYFSGHGRKHNEKGSFVPFGANKPYNNISLSILNEILEPIKARHIFIIIDACFSGLLLKSNKKNITTDITKQKSRYLLTSGRDESVSDGLIGENSPFAKSLMKILNEAKNDVNIVELSQKVVNEVRHLRNENQTPDHGYMDISGNDRGQFMLKMRNNESFNNLLEIYQKLSEISKKRLSTTSEYILKIQENLKFHNEKYDEPKYIAVNRINEYMIDLLLKHLEEQTINTFRVTGNHMDKLNRLLFNSINESFKAASHNDLEFWHTKLSGPYWDYNYKLIERNCTVERIFIYNSVDDIYKYRGIFTRQIIMGIKVFICHENDTTEFVDKADELDFGLIDDYAVTHYRVGTGRTLELKIGNDFNEKFENIFNNLKQVSDFLPSEDKFNDWISKNILEGNTK